MPIGEYETLKLQSRNDGTEDETVFNVPDGEVWLVAEYNGAIVEPKGDETVDNFVHGVEITNADGDTRVYQETVDNVEGTSSGDLSAYAYGGEDVVRVYENKDDGMDDAESRTTVYLRRVA